jgi:hypothetical protein
MIEQSGRLSTMKSHGSGMIRLVAKAVGDCITPSAQPDQDDECDLEQRRSITLLADREAETLAQRLATTPRVGLGLWRDRAATYAAARPVWKRVLRENPSEKTPQQSPNRHGGLDPPGFSSPHLP